MKKTALGLQDPNGLPASVRICTNTVNATDISRTFVWIARRLILLGMNSLLRKVALLSFEQKQRRPTELSEAFVPGNDALSGGGTSGIISTEQSMPAYLK